MDNLTFFIQDGTFSLIIKLEINSAGWFPYPERNEKWELFAQECSASLLLDLFKLSKTKIIDWHIGIIIIIVKKKLWVSIQCE